MPQDVLIHFPPCFKAAFQGGWKEGVEGELHIKGQKKKHFKLIFPYML